MKTDIIIPTYRPGASLEELLKRLLQQELLPNRVIIMNTEEDLWDADRFEVLFDGSPVGLTVQHLSREAFDHGGTRHRGILLSDADVCICMTQDAIPYDRKLGGAGADHRLPGRHRQSHRRALPLRGLCRRKQSRPGFLFLRAYLLQLLSV